MEKRPTPRTQTGIVLSDKMDKTVVVQVSRRFRHSAYKKYIMRRSKFMAHDERDECKVGDTVIIKESRPLSKNKRWQVHKIVTRAREG